MVELMVDLCWYDCESEEEPFSYLYKGSQNTPVLSTYEYVSSSCVTRIGKYERRVGSFANQTDHTVSREEEGAYQDKSECGDRETRRANLIGRDRRPGRCSLIPNSQLNAAIVPKRSCPSWHRRVGICRRHPSGLGGGAWINNPTRPTERKHLQEAVRASVAHPPLCSTI